MADSDVPAILATLRDEADEDLIGDFYTMEDYYERKLWHQLTVLLNEFFTNPKSAPLRMRVFEQLVSLFADKISQKSLVSMGLSAASQIEDPKEALSFMSNLAIKVNNPSSQDAYAYAFIETGQLELTLGNNQGCRDVLDKAGKILELLDSVDPTILAANYRVNADYYRTVGDYSSYYKNSLLYLACVQDLQTQLPIDKQRQRAYDLSLAALLGSSIYSFGELLLHPILDCLKDTQYDWLRQLLFTVSAGDMDKFEGLSGHFTEIPALQQSAILIRQKVCLSALVELFFHQPPSDRTLSFETLAKSTRLDQDEIEHLVMKALSVGLVQGSIDQVSQTVTVTWIQPRIMNHNQIESMRQRLLTWDTSVKDLATWMELVGKDVWAVA